jgi:hypothetical protein
MSNSIMASQLVTYLEAQGSNMPLLKGKNKRGEKIDSNRNRNGETTSREPSGL